jgi:hypothetical protein
MRSLKRSLRLRVEEIERRAGKAGRICVVRDDEPVPPNLENDVTVVRIRRTISSIRPEGFDEPEPAIHSWRGWWRP